MDMTYIHGNRYLLMVASHPSYEHFENFLFFHSTKIITEKIEF